MEYPKISIWITSTGRYTYTKATIDSFLKHNTYPNYEILVVESVPTETTFTKDFPHHKDTPIYQFDKNKEYLEQLQRNNDNIKVWFRPWEYLGNVRRFLLDNTYGDYFMLLNDDVYTYVDNKDHICEAINALCGVENICGITMGMELGVWYIRGIKLSCYPYENVNVVEKKILRNLTVIPKELISIAPLLLSSRIFRELREYAFRERDNISAMWQSEMDFRDALCSAGYYVCNLMNYWGWCGHGSVHSTKSINFMTYSEAIDYYKGHIQCRDFYRQLVLRGLAGYRDINFPWGTAEENQKRVNWDWYSDSERAIRQCSKCGYINDTLDLTLAEWTCVECSKKHNTTNNQEINLSKYDKRMPYYYYGVK